MGLDGITREQVGSTADNIGSKLGRLSEVHMTTTTTFEETVSPDETALITEFVRSEGRERGTGSREGWTGPTVQPGARSGVRRSRIRSARRAARTHRVGLFAMPGRYRATIRFANATSASDRERDTRGMAVSVAGVPARIHAGTDAAGLRVEQPSGDGGTRCPRVPGLAQSERGWRPETRHLFRSASEGRAESRRRRGSGTPVTSTSPTGARRRMRSARTAR